MTIEKVADCPGATTSATGEGEPLCPGMQVGLAGHPRTSGRGLLFTVRRTTALVSVSRPLSTSTKYSPACQGWALRSVRSGGTGFSTQAGPQPAKATSRGIDDVEAFASESGCQLKYHRNRGRGRPVARILNVTALPASMVWPMGCSVIRNGTWPQTAQPGDPTSAHRAAWNAPQTPSSLWITRPNTVS